MLCQSELATRPTAGALAAGGSAEAGAPFALGQTFQLHSNPGADLVIYLDFDGHTTIGTTWNSEYNNGNTIVSPGYSADADPGFSTAELEYIQRVWQRVAEDFAPFTVDVTTADPGVERLRKFGAGDTQWGIRAVITPDQSWLIDDKGPSGGWAYYGAFQWNTDTPVFVFNGSQWTDRFAEIAAADTFSHEVGHSLGLFHHGTTTGKEYYEGHGSGTTGWAPIMGASFNKELSQWSNGGYPNFNNAQDDLAIITNPALNGGGWGYSGLTFRTDDHGDEIFGNGAVEATSLTPELTGLGIIETAADVDTFRFDWAGGSFTIAVGGARGSNLDVLAELLDSSGTVVATSNPIGQLAAWFSDLSLAAGEYFLRIQGVGKLSDGISDFGYSDYGSLGQYWIALTDPADDAYEENDSLVTAADPMGNGGQWEQTLLSSISGKGTFRDDDWYEIFVSPDFHYLAAQLLFNRVEGDLVLSLYDASGNFITSSWSADTYEYISTPVWNGQYFLRVENRTPGTFPNIDYDLTWDDLPTNPPQISVTASPAGLFEDDPTGTFSFTFTKVGGLDEATTVYFAVLNSNPSQHAVYGIDYTQSGALSFSETVGSVYFAAGESTVTVTIRPVADTDIELPELIELLVSDGMPGTFYTRGENAYAQATIGNDDWEPGPSIVQIRYGYGTNRWVDASELAARTAPWKIKAIEITFNRNVDVQADDLQVFTSMGFQFGFSNFTYDSTTFKAVWRFFVEYDRERLTFRLDGDDPMTDGTYGVRATAGYYPFDGGFLEGGDKEWSLDVLFGDVDGDRNVNLIDALLQRGRNGTTDIWADIDGDGVVNLIDALLLRGRNGTTLP